MVQKDPSETPSVVQWTRSWLLRRSGYAGSAICDGKRRHTWSEQSHRRCGLAGEVDGVADAAVFDGISEEMRLDCGLLPPDVVQSVR